MWSFGPSRLRLNIHWEKEAQSRFIIAFELFFDAFFNVVPDVMNTSQERDPGTNDEQHPDLMMICFQVKNYDSCSRF
jgi:hypothetical protein